MKQWFTNLFKNYFISYFPAIVIFVASLANPSDSDLGWHLKYGEYFFQHGSVLRQNIFSTMMAGYHWINSSWGTDLVTYLTFHFTGFVGLSILGALTVTLTLYFFSKVGNLGFWEKSILFVVVGYIESPLTNVSFRGQLLSLLFISLLFYLLGKINEGKIAYLFLTIPLFFLWVNMHGGFVIGLGLFAVWGGFYLVRELYQSRHQAKSSLYRTIVFSASIFFSAILVTLINPFGFGVYQESLRHFGNPWQRYIVEWLPFDKFSNLWWQFVVWGFILGLSILVIAWKRQFLKKLPFIGSAVLLYALAIWMRRYAWPLYLVSIPVVASLVSFLKPRNERISYILSGTLLVLYYLFIIMFKIPLEQFTSMSWVRYCTEYVYCSPQSAEFLRTAKLSGRMLTFYNWGGWLIWLYPEIKPSIDGRMHLWEEGGYSAFAEYYPLEQNWKDINTSQFDIVYITPKKPIFNRLVELVNQGSWQILYSDEYAAVFARKNKP